MKKYIFSLLILLIPSFVFSATRTVGPSGKDHTTIQAAEDVSSCGDTIEVYADTYSETIIVDVAGTCTSGSFLTIKAMEAGVTVDSDSSNTNTLEIREPYTVIDGNGYGFAFTGAGPNGSTSYRAAIWIENAGDYTILDDVHVSGTTGGDNSTCNSSSPPCGIADVWVDYSHHVTIRNSSFTSRYAKYNVNYDSSSDGVFQNNEVANGYFIISRFWHFDDSIMEKNYFHSTYSTPSGNGGIYLRDSNNVVVRYNISTNIGGDDHVLSIWDDANNTGNENWAIYNNIFYNDSSFVETIQMYSGGSQSLQYITFKNNIIKSGSAGSIEFGKYQSGFSDNITFDNNLFDPVVDINIASGSHTYTNTNYETGSADFLGGDMPVPYYKPTNTSATQVDVGIDYCWGFSFETSCSGGAYTGTDYDEEPVKRDGIIDMGALEFQPSASNDDYTTSTITDSALASTLPNETNDYFGIKLDICDGAVGSGCAASSGNNTGSFTGMIITLNCTGTAGTGDASAGDISCVSVYDDSGGSVGSYDGTDAKLNASCGSESAGEYTITFDSAETVTDTESGYYWVVVTTTSGADTAKSLSPCMADQNAIIISSPDSYADTRQLPTAADLTVTTIDSAVTPPVPCKLVGTIKGSFQ
jgi:hypothetical protein